MNQPTGPIASLTMLDRARAYAGSGLPVFPCQPGGKAPITAKGFHDATTDTEVVRHWWTKHPTANITAPTEAPGFHVLDVDVDVRADGDGWAACGEAQHAGLIGGWTRVIRTPSGGLHLHYPGTAQRNGSLRGQHLDFRGTGGYVLLPPSLGTTDTYRRRYEVLAHRPGPGRPLNWAAVAELLTPGPPPRSSAPVRVSGADSTRWLAEHVARQTEDNRDNALFWAACRAAEAGATDLTPLVDAAVSTGLGLHQAARTVRSARDTVSRTAAQPAPFTSCLSRLSR